MAGTKNYVMTNAAGRTVAGRRVPGIFDKTGRFVLDLTHVLKLTDAEAEYELGQGTITLMAEPEATDLSVMTGAPDAPKPAKVSRSKD